MSPLSLRRYRAERLLQREFEALQHGVLTRVRARLRAMGATLDRSDLEACYAQAWHGLYMEVLGGAEIANPAGWLVVVTFRRAVEEQRARRHIAYAPGGEGRDVETQLARELESAHAQRDDLAGDLDDRVKLRQLFEALHVRLPERERDAAVLCYLHGLSRAEAAERMGISEARMRKLMDGRGGDRPGVAPKVAKLLETIRAGAWCEEQGSLMRALAYGVLDPEGERYRLAHLHRRECSACRAYVLSLRGLAAALPPLPALAHAILGSSVAAGGAAASGIRSLGAGGGSGAQGALSPAAGVAGASAGAGAGAGGGWVIAGGPLGAKLAAGCLLALGVGAGCIAIGTGSERSSSAPRHGRRSHAQQLSAQLAGEAAEVHPAAAGGAPSNPARNLGSPTPASATRLSASAASREFGLERAPAGGTTAGAGSGSAASAPRARAAAVRPASLGLERIASAGAAADEPASVAPAGGGSSRPPVGSAEHEFSPG